MRSSELRRLLIGCIAGMLTALALITVALGNDTVVQTMSSGSRTATVSDLNLSALTYSHSNQISSGTMTLTVDDASGTGEGWNVTIQSSNLTYSGLYGGSAIPSGNLSISLANPPSLIAGQAIDGTNGPKVPAAGGTGSLESARTVLQANSGYGMGSYSQTLNVSLAVPGMSRTGSYTAALTVTISAGP